MNRITCRNPTRSAPPSAARLLWDGAEPSSEFHAASSALRIAAIESAAVIVLIRVQVYKKAFRRRGVWIDSVRGHKAGRVYHITGAAVLADKLKPIKATKAAT